jgi:GntR family transcriptional regulator
MGGETVVVTRPRGAVVHKHVQVREYVRSLVGDAEPGAPAPSERELVQLFGVARMTVRQALDALVAEGLLERIPGRGTFVAETRVDNVPRLTGFSEEMVRRGMRPSSRTLVARVESAGPGVARALDVNVGQHVVHWQRLRLADDQPMCIEDAYLDLDLVPGLLEHLPVSLYAELERRSLAPTWGEDSVEAGLAQEAESRLLGVATGNPVLRVARRAFCDRSPVEVSRSTYRADRFTMWVPLTRVPQPRR